MLCHSGQMVLRRILPSRLLVLGGLAFPIAHHSQSSQASTLSAGSLLPAQHVANPFPVPPPQPLPLPEGGGDRNAIPLYVFPNEIDEALRPEKGAPDLSGKRKGRWSKLSIGARRASPRSIKPIVYGDAAAAADLLIRDSERRCAAVLLRLAGRRFARSARRKVGRGSGPRSRVWRARPSAAA